MSFGESFLSEENVHKIKIAVVAKVALFCDAYGIFQEPKYTGLCKNGEFQSTDTDFFRHRLPQVPMIVNENRRCNKIPRGLKKLSFLLSVADLTLAALCHVRSFSTNCDRKSLPLEARSPSPLSPFSTPRKKELGQHSTCTSVLFNVKSEAQSC